MNNLHNHEDNSTTNTADSSAHGSSHDLSCSSSRDSSPKIAPFDANSLVNKPISRRRFVLGSAGVLITIVGTTAILSGCQTNTSTSTSAADTQTAQAGELEVTSDQVVDSSDFAELDSASCVTLAAQYNLPIKTIGNMSSDTLAAMLTPGNTPDVLMQAAILQTANGNMTPVLTQAVSHADGYQIYDVRLSEQIIIWTECNFRTDDWRVYVAPVLSPTSIGSAVLVDEGDANFDPPMLCVSQNSGWWTVMPTASGQAATSDSYLKRIFVGQSTPEVVYVSHGRMATNPEASGGIVTIVPRADTPTTRYQLTAINAASAEVVASQILPRSMRAYDAIYLDGNFVFSIQQSYNYSSGISRFGTYAKIDDSTYMRFNRVPMDVPAKCGKYLFIKSTRSVIGLDLQSQSFFTINTVAGSESYGDFLLSTGQCNQIATITSVPSADGTGQGNVVVRVFNVL